MRAEREIVEVLNQLSPHGPSISSPGRGGRGPRFSAGEVAGLGTVRAIGDYRPWRIWCGITSCHPDPRK